MAQNSTKKRTAVVATATAAALLLTGTFAWTLATDDTVLNAFSDTDKGDYSAEIVEKFDPENPWTEKVVTVKNTADNPVIVRVRFEEFYDLTSRVGSEYDVPEGYLENTEGASAIFYKDGKSTLTGTSADSSTNLDTAITLNFGTGVVTMDEYNTLTDKSNVEWVIDEDGWCYYTKALLAGETTENLLERVDFNETNFNYNQPYDLNYKINVRLQAISADLEDFGSDTDDAQWTNTDYVNDQGVTVTDTATAGRIIAADDRTDDYEITADSTITAAARDLVNYIGAVRVASAKEVKNALYDPEVSSVVLTENVTLTSSDMQCLIMQDYMGDKILDLDGHTLDSSGLYLPTVYFYDNPGTSVVIKNGTIDTGDNILAYANCEPSVTDSIELINVDVTSNTNMGTILGSNITLIDSTITNTYPGGNALLVQKDSNVVIENSTVTSGGTTIISNYDATNVTIDIKNSTIESTESSEGNEQGTIVPNTGWVVNAENSTFRAKGTVIWENHWCVPEGLYFKDCDFEAGTVGVYKVTESALTLDGCNFVIDTAEDTVGLGLFLREGDITLKNTNVTVNQNNGLAQMATVEEMDEYYNSTGSCKQSYEAMQIILNSYGNINLNIDNCSFTTNVTMDGARSVYVFDALGTYDEGALLPGEPGDFTNTITLTGNNTFTPATDAFDQNYNFTTITK